MTTLRVLMVGPLPPPIGGITVSFQILLNLLLRRNDLSIAVVDFSAIRRQRGGLLSGFFSLLHAVLIKVKQADVICVSCASTALPSLGLLLLSVARLCKKPLVIRKAAGFDYLDIGGIRGAMAHYVVKHSHLYLAETRSLVVLARQRGLHHVEWFPNHRPLARLQATFFSPTRTCRRFVYVGQVREMKGIREIAAAAERFDEKIQVDLYGPVFDDVEATLLSGGRCVRYKGILAADDVVPVLQQYDMFLLPSKSATEGYPGAIIEAYSAGLPLITTRLGGIPEIVDEGCGLFVEPGNADGLYTAMKRVVEDDELYRLLVRGVARKRQEFDSAPWIERFIDHCRRVAVRRPLSGRGDERAIP